MMRRLKAANKSVSYSQVLICKDVQTESERLFAFVPGHGTCLRDLWPKLCFYAKDIGH